MASKPKRPKMTKPSRPGPRVKQTRFRKKIKKETVEIISRKGQGLKWSMPAKVPALEEQVAFHGQVASSWIASYKWTGLWAHMILLNGFEYLVFIPFNVMQGWYYALSKGTYFNERIKGKYTVIRIK